MKTDEGPYLTPILESSEITTLVRFARIAIGNTEADKTNAAILAAVKQLG